MAADTEQRFQPPYLSWATFEGILEQLRTVGMPGRLDRSVLRSRSGGDQSQFLRAAHNFGLLDAGDVPTPRMHDLVGFPERRPIIMRTILEENYADVIALGTDATPQMLTEEFRKFGIEGDTVRKAIAFYLTAARFAEIPLSPHFKATRPGTGGRKRRTAKGATGNGGSSEPQDFSPPPDPYGGMHPAIQTLVKALPAFADDASKPEFPSGERAAWFAYAEATFNLIYAYPEGDTGGAS